MTDALLATVAPLAHPARVTALWEYGRVHPMADIVAELESRGRYYEQRVAATLAAAAGDTKWAAAHIADANPSVRRKALQLASRLPDADIKVALQDAPAAVRFPLYRQLKGRPALADELVETVRTEWGEDEAARLLPWCSEPVVRRLLPALLLALARTQLWRPLAISHPQALQSALATDLDQSIKDGITPTDWWGRYGMAVAMLVKHADMAKEALDLIETHKYHPTSAFDGYIAAYFRLEPERTLSYFAKLLRREISVDVTGRFSYICLVSSGPGRRTYRRLVRSGLPQVEELTKAFGVSVASVTRLPLYLKAFPPSERAKHYELFKGGKREMLFETEVCFDILPKSYLARLARDALPRFRAMGSWAYLMPLAFLPQCEVQDEFLEATQQPDAGVRSMAWRYYITSGKAGGAQALARVAGEAARRLRNEQRPVRSTAISALAAVPARLWNEDALEHITTIMKDAAEARDGAGEWRTFDRIAVAVLVAHPDSSRHVEWVKETFGILFKLDNDIDVPDLARLRKGQEATIWNVYKPFIAAQAANDRYETLFNLARALGKRATDMPELHAALWLAIVSKSSDSDTITSALELWLKPRSLRSTRVAEVVAHDKSMLSVSTAAAIVATQRTDLLDSALGSAPDGVFKLASAWVFPAPKHSARFWTPAQTTAFISQLEKCASDTKTPTRQKMHALKRLKWVPGGFKLARSLATDNHNDGPVVEVGLEALYTSPADLGLLYSFAGSDYARVAMYSAAGAAHREHPSALEAHLADLLKRDKVKVTSKKETIRQATSLLPLKASVPLLDNLAAKEDLHRDVRTACVMAATRMLSTDTAWDVVRNALATDERFVKEAVCTVSPLDLTQEQRIRYAPFIVGLVRDESIDVKLAAVRALAVWVPFSHDGGSVLVRTLTDMLAPVRLWQAAAHSLIEWGNIESLLSVVGTLIDYGDVLDPGGEEDMPAVRRIEEIATKLLNKRHDTRYRLVMRAVADVLAKHRDFVPAAARLRMDLVESNQAVELVDGDQPDQLLQELRDIVRLVSDRPMLAYQLCTSITNRPSRWPQSTNTVVARKLVDDGDTVGSLFAIALLARNGKEGRQAWTDERREILWELRRHPNADVRDEARRTRVRGTRGEADNVYSEDDVAD